jgi:LmbE family N-acetylglucosaminyl deacetylase
MGEMAADLFSRRLGNLRPDLLFLGYGSGWYTLLMTLAAVFAHPDDEVFGPGGSLIHLAKKDDVYLICVTNGDRPGRKGELKRAAKVMGIKKVAFLNFADGSLNNNNYHQLAQAIEKKLRRYRPETVMTFEPRGVSGHLDHVAVSMVVSFVVKRLRFVKKVLYFCELKRTMELLQKNFGDYFIYVPPGYKRNEIDLVINTEAYWQIRLKAMACHKSQRGDSNRIIKTLTLLPKREHFLVRQFQRKSRAVV